VPIEMFCPKCKSLMFPQANEEGQKVFVCRHCGYEMTVGKEKERISEKAADKELAVIEGENVATLPKTKAECPKCGNNEAYFILRQTRAADEPETRIYRCTKCGHTWREY